MNLHDFFLTKIIFSVYFWIPKISPHPYLSKHCSYIMLNYIVRTYG